TIGIRPEEVRHLVITHFHADHVGGLAEFPNATVYYHERALAPFITLSPFRQTRAAFLPLLIPPGFEARSSTIPSASFSKDEEVSFPTMDLFADGSLKLVELPGHAPGQI